MSTSPGQAKSEGHSLGINGGHLSRSFQGTFDNKDAAEARREGYWEGVRDRDTAKAIASESAKKDK